MSDSPPPASPPRRVARTYGRRKDIAPLEPSHSDDAGASLSTTRANAHIISKHSDDEVEPDSDGLDVPPDTSIMEDVDHEMQSEDEDEVVDDENATDSSNVPLNFSRFALDGTGNYSFGFKEAMKELDSGSITNDSTTNGILRSHVNGPLSPTSGTAALDEDAPMSLARTPTLSASDTEDVFGGSLATLTGTGSAPSTASPARVAPSLSSSHASSIPALPASRKRPPRRVVDSDSDEEEGDRTVRLQHSTQPSKESVSLETSSPASADPHSIDYTPSKDAEDYTPPTSDIDMPLATTDSSVDGRKKGKPTKGKGKAKVTRDVAPLEFAAPVDAGLPLKSGPKSKSKVPGEKKLKVRLSVYSWFLKLSLIASHNSVCSIGGATATSTFFNAIVQISFSSYVTTAFESERPA